LKAKSEAFADVISAINIFPMNVRLAPHEIRVIGALIEKEISTPDQYPLSLNALSNACNQKSNRDPVLDLDQTEVQQIVDGLIKKFLVSEQSGYGSRVPKYQHRFCNTAVGTLQFSPQELAVLCELFLRGAQTPGELRSRASRLCAFGDVTEMETVLASLAAREEGPFVARLPREPGRRESRYVHLFGSELDQMQEGEAAEAASDGQPEDARDDRLIQLEQRVASLEDAVARLEQQLNGVQ
jgi:uncharacterized protein YceH (UPF0502 family)